MKNISHFWHWPFSEHERKSIPRGLPSWLLVGLLLAFSSPGLAELQATWTQRADIPAEEDNAGVRVWLQIAHDTLRNKTVIFGGALARYRNDIWTYDLADDDWAQIEPQVDCPLDDFVPPPSADEHVFAYDSHNDYYWTFAGAGYKCNRGPVRTAGGGTTIDRVVDSSLEPNEADYYKDWTVSLVGGPPYGLQAYVESYDPLTKTLVLATPISELSPGSEYELHTQRTSATFYYDPKIGEWTGFEGPHWDYNGPLPPNRFSPGFAFSPIDRALVMFGGGYGYNDTWAMDVETLTWIQLNANGSTDAPPKRTQIQNGMVYDSHSDVFILFGGKCNDDSSRCSTGNLNDTWVYKLDSNTWTEMQPPRRPPARKNHHLAFDPVNNVAVLFGGINDQENSLGDTWVYDYLTDTWTKLSPAQSPGGRDRGAMVYDAKEGVFVLYGGLSDSAKPNEIWTLHLAGDGAANQAPVANFSVSPAAGNTETLFVFDGGNSFDVDGQIVSYQWNFRDGTTASEAMVQHQFPGSGDYNVKLTVTDDEGATGQTVTTVAVTAVGSPAQIDVTSVVIHGEVDDPSVKEILVNGTMPLPVSNNGEFSFEQPLEESPTVVEFEATNDQNITSTKKVTVSTE